MLSSDRLKAFASLERSNGDDDNWDTNFEGDLITIKGPVKSVEPDGHELETIRPYRVKPDVTTTNPKATAAPRGAGHKPSYSEPPRPRSPVKAHAEAKFVLPSRPAIQYQEQSVEDYSDLFVDNDTVFDRRPNIVKVRGCYVDYEYRRLIYR
jgi:hypothetical protein